MATVLAGSDGDFHHGDTWAGGKVPEPEDVADANGRVVVVRKDVTCKALTNRTQGGTFYCARYAHIDVELQPQTFSMVTSAKNLDSLLDGRYTTKGG